MYKVISTDGYIECQDRINEFEKDGFTLLCFSVAMAGYYERDYTAVMHKPDTSPVPHMTTEQYLAARTPLERLAVTADEVLREEARQYGVGR